MKLWLVRPREHLPDHMDPWLILFNKAVGFVIRAASEPEARQIASDNAENEGAAAWQDERFSTCDELADVGPAGVILREFQGRG